jgi:cytochrome c553
LKDYKTGKRKNPVMAEQAKNLSDADMLDLATYFSAQRGLTLKY